MPWSLGFVFAMEYLGHSLITGALRPLSAIKAQFSTKPNWASNTMVFFSVYFYLTDALRRWMCFYPGTNLNPSKIQDSGGVLPAGQGHGDNLISLRSSCKLRIIILFLGRIQQPLHQV